MINNTKRYKKYIYYTLILSGLGWIVLQLLVYFLCRPPEWYWIHDIITIKENIALNAPGNKVVFVGGSATLFGVRTEDIEKELKIPIVNYGVHAGLEIDYILERAKRILKPGDVAILPLEYEHLIYDGSLNEIRTRYVLLFDKDYFKSLPFFDKIQYIFKFSPLTIELTFWSELWKILGNKNCLRTYDAKTLNKNGDETNNIGNNIIKQKYDEFGPIVIQKRDFKETPGLKLLTNFNKWCMGHNIKFFVTYAPTIAFKVYNDNKYQEYFIKVQEYLTDHNIKAIGSPNDFFYGKDYFYDTQYHLNSYGMTYHTKKLISKMKDLFHLKGSFICRDCLDQRLI